MDVQYRRRELALQRHQGATSLELLHRPRRSFDTPQRHGGAVGRLAETERCRIWQSGQSLRIRSRKGKSTVGRGRLYWAETAVVQGDDFDLRIRPDVAAADERVSP